MVPVHRTGPRSPESVNGPLHGAGTPRLALASLGGPTVGDLGLGGSGVAGRVGAAAVRAGASLRKCFCTTTYARIGVPVEPAGGALGAGSPGRNRTSRGEPPRAAALARAGIRLSDHALASNPPVPRNQRVPFGVAGATRLASGHGGGPRADELPGARCGPDSLASSAFDCVLRSRLVVAGPVRRLAIGSGTVAPGSDGGTARTRVGARILCVARLGWVDASPRVRRDCGRSTPSSPS